MIERKIISEGNFFIKQGDLFQLQELYESNMNYSNSVFDWLYIFKELFINSCIYNQLHISIWLYEMYQNFDEIQKILFKPTFKYVKYIKKSNISNDRPHIEWFQKMGF